MVKTFYKSSMNFPLNVSRSTTFWTKIEFKAKSVVRESTMKHIENDLWSSLNSIVSDAMLIDLFICLCRGSNRFFSQIFLDASIRIRIIRRRHRQTRRLLLKPSIVFIMFKREKRIFSVFNRSILIFAQRSTSLIYNRFWRSCRSFTRIIGLTFICFKILVDQRFCSIIEDL